MTTNSQQLLNDVLTQRRQHLAPDLSESEYFELFCAEQLLKDFSLSYDELRSGIVDGEHDGGVDSVYAFVNGELVLEDFDASNYRKDVRIELYIIQSKMSGGFSENPINRLISATTHLLRLDANYDHLPQYNDGVKAAMDNFRRAYRSLAAKFPTLKIRYYYASKSPHTDIHENLSLKAKQLEDACSELFSEGDVGAEFVGARRLLDLARMRPVETHTLRATKTLSDVGGYVVLSSLHDYVAFLRSDDDVLQSDLFETNVRDFQGATEVNDEIAKSLRNDRNVEFWWMNNGVTIISNRATLTGDTVTIENPQIVNGLQTSMQIDRHFSGDPEDRRSVMIKIIASEHDDTRDKIIKATNRQNSIPAASLRATDKIQRDIEEAMKSHGLFYDRRKNFYKNEGKPAAKIIRIPLMAQAVMSIILQKPDTARARPSSLIKSNDVYKEIFSPQYPIQLYTNAAALTRRVDAVLRSRTEMKARDRTNLRFYVLYWLVAWATKNADPRANDVANLDVESVDDSEIERATDRVWELYDQRGRSDQVAKGPELRTAVIGDATLSIEEFHRSAGRKRRQAADR